MARGEIEGVLSNQGSKGAEAWPVEVKAQVPPQFRYGGKRTYACGMQNIALAPGALTINTITNLGTIFHPQSVPLVYRLVKIGLSCTGGTGGVLRIMFNRATALAAAPGGTVQTPTSFRSTYPPSGAQYFFNETNAPTRAGEVFAWRYSPGSIDRYFEWNAGDIPECEALVCEPGNGEGWTMHSINEAALSTLPFLNVYMVWTEE